MVTDDVDLNNADIDLRPELLSSHHSNNSISLKPQRRQYGVSGSNSSSFHQRNHSHIVRNAADNVPNYLRKTLSSQAKQKLKNGPKTPSSSSNSRSNRNTNVSTLAAASRSSFKRPTSLVVEQAMRQNQNMSILARSPHKILSDDSSAEVSICATSEAAALFHNQKSHHDSFAQTQQVTMISSINNSASKTSAKIRSSTKKQKQNVKRQEFKDLTKRQNRLAQSTIQAMQPNINSRQQNMQRLNTDNMTSKKSQYGISQAKASS